ncbi:UDP-glucuronosyltransferase [Aphelenchoides bicaudatus]|nr:UDP-glucuronosyltransferase [Aphelenchoides bicaudatus]
MKSVLIVLTLLASGNALKILMYNPKSSKSHVGFVNNVGSALIDAGHEVVMYMPELDNTFGNASNHKKARIIERKCDFFDPEQASAINGLKVGAWTQDPSISTLIKSLSKLGSFFKTSCMHQLADEKVMQQLREERFDLGFSEFFDSCGFGIFQKIGLEKHILLYSSLFPSTHAASYGIPPTPSFVPELHANAAPPFTFKQRFMNQIGYFMGRFAIDKYFVERVAEAFAPNNVTGNVRDMLAKSSFFYVNTDELVDFPRPISHKVVQIAGMGVKKALEKRGKLEKKYQDVFDNSKKGVIYISFGSVASSMHMPDNLKQAFLQSFKEFPDVTFLWKYEDPDDPIVKNIPNLVVGSWLPQKEIFAQDKLLAFVSHGGMNSVVEATSSGIPIIGLPLFADQYRNTLMAQSKEVGIKLEKDAVTKDIIVNVFRKIIEDPSFKKNANTLAQMIANKPMGPDERIVKYAEFAARFDVHEALDMTGRHLNTIEFYNLDVLASMALLAVSALVILILLIKFALRLLIAKLFGKTKRD